MLSHDQFYRDELFPFLCDWFVRDGVIIGIYCRESYNALVHMSFAFRFDVTVEIVALHKPEIIFKTDVLQILWLSVGLGGETLVRQFLSLSLKLWHYSTKRKKKKTQKWIRCVNLLHESSTSSCLLSIPSTGLSTSRHMFTEPPHILHYRRGHTEDDIAGSRAARWCLETYDSRFFWIFGLTSFLWLV